MDTINFVLNVLDICDLIESVESNVESEDSNENEPAISDSNIDVHDRANDNIEVEKSDVDKIEETMTGDDFDNESPIDSELEDLDVNNDTSNLVVEAVINTIIEKVIDHDSNEVPTLDYALGDFSANNDENVNSGNLENNIDTKQNNIPINSDKKNL